ncbi:MAG: hypothetical protein IKW74_05940, partial [Thermoguttaceae bacterium]|nr:hypothetical protein [Thermoguttaceae bacterium]
MLKTQGNILLTMLLLLLLLGGSVDLKAQSPEGTAYSHGINAFFSGNYEEASAFFAQVMQQIPDDPRAFFFHGLCASRTGDPVTADRDYRQGAEQEFSERGRLININDALSRIQGEERVVIEQVRKEARLKWKQAEELRLSKLYGNNIERRNNELTAAKSDASVSVSDEKSGVAAIKPLSRPESDVTAVADLYSDDPDSQFNAFRDSLGKTVLSTREQERLREKEKRVVYTDPMDRPAADGSPFIDIYGADEVYIDDNPFVGTDDPDDIYAADEKGVLTDITDAVRETRQGIFGMDEVQSSKKGAPGMMGGMEMPMMMPPMEMPPMPTMMMPGMMVDPEKKVIEYSANDDTNLVFENPDMEANSFTGNLPPVKADSELDLFKDDREYSTKPASSGAGGMMMMD